MYLLLDENCGRALAALADRLGHTAQRSIQTVELGRSASDRTIFDYACRNGARIVTINHRDFLNLAATSSGHHGLLLIPSIAFPDLRPLFTALLRAAEPLMEVQRNLVVEIAVDGAISSFRSP